MPPTPLEEIFFIIISSRPFRNQKKIPDRHRSRIKKGLAGSESGLWTFSVTALPGANRWRCLGGLLYAVPYPKLLCVAHTCHVRYSLPLVRKANSQVSYLKYCTQAELT